MIPIPSALFTSSSVEMYGRFYKEKARTVAIEWNCELSLFKSELVDQQSGDGFSDMLSALAMVAHLPKNQRKQSLEVVVLHYVHSQQLYAVLNGSGG